MQIAHTKKMRLLHEVKGVEEAPMRKIVGIFEEAHQADIHNRTTNSITNTVAGVLTDFINNSVAGVLTHLQDNYSHLMPHDLLEWEDITKNTI